MVTGTLRFDEAEFEITQDGVLYKQILPHRAVAVPISPTQESFGGHG